MAKRRKTRSIYQRADSRWALELEMPKGPDGKRRRKTIYGETPEEVEEKAREFQKLDKGGPSLGNPKTVDDLAGFWLDSVRSQKSWNYFLGCRSTYRNHVQPEIGKTRLPAVRQHHIQRILDKATGMNAASKRTMLMKIHSLLDSQTGKLWAVNPCSGVETGATESRKRAFLSPSQAKRLLDASRETDDGPLWCMLLLCGLRIGEALGLQWDAVDFESKTIRISQQLQRIDGELRLIPPKSKSSSATIPMPEPVERALLVERARQAERRLRAGSRWRNSQLVFCSDTGQPLQHIQILRSLKKQAEDLGLPHITPHVLRHSTASLLVSIGVHIKIVQEIMRHANYQITADTYSHVAIDLQRDALSKLSAIFV